MKKLTIDQIDKKLANILVEEDPFIKKLTNDERKGVQQLLTKWKNKKDKEKVLQKKFEQMTAEESSLRQQGYTYIAGIDEVGRGPLAGPVVAAAVILPVHFHLLGINDSKTLSKKKREQYFDYISEHAIATSVGIVQAEEIDEINIYEATKKAMLLAVQQLKQSPEYLLIDAMELATNIPQSSLVKGDEKSISIAAASIIAKVTRDRLMTELGKKFPEYQFENNMGYGTKDHLQGIEKYGITAYHRKSFAPIANK